MPAVTARERMDVKVEDIHREYRRDAMTGAVVEVYVVKGKVGEAPASGVIPMPAQDFDRMSAKDREQYVRRTLPAAQEHLRHDEER